MRLGFAPAPQQVIPEPGTLALLGTGLPPLAGMLARRRPARRGVVYNEAGRARGAPGFFCPMRAEGGENGGE